MTGAVFLKGIYGAIKLISIILFISIILSIFFAILFLKYPGYEKIILKKIFKIKTFNDFFQIVLALVLLTWSAFISTLLIMSQLSPHGCGESIASFKTGYKKSVSVLNQSILMSYDLDKKDPSTCDECNSNEKALAKFFTKRINVIESYNI